MSFAAAAKTSPPDATAPWTAAPVLGPAPAFDLPAARRYCAAMATSHYENFPVFLAPFSAEQREALAAVYAFARTADDFADEPAFDGRRDRLLDGWETALCRCFDGRVDHPVFVALREAIARFALEPRPFFDLLSAFRQDVRVQRYATFDDVLDYCHRSADPVGRLVLRILRIDDPLARGWSDRLCTALQLANFWQDLAVDVPRGRLYVPLADLDRFAVPLVDVLEQRPTRRIGALLRFELDRTAALFSAGFPLVAHAGWPGGAYLAAVWAGGMSIVGMTRALGPAILRERPGLGGRSVTRWAWSVLRRSRVNT